MVKIMRNSKRILTITLICAFSLLALGACGDTTAEAETETDYGTIYFVIPRNGYGFPINESDQLGEDKRNIVVSIMMGALISSITSYKVPISIKNVESCNKPIIYADGYDENTENAIVTSKWLYYASLMLANYERKDLYSFGIKYTPQFHAAIGADPEYCLEKLSLSCYYSKNFKESLNMDASEISKFCNLFPEQAEYYNQVVAAALYRYGELDLNGFENKIGLLKFNRHIGNSKDFSLNVVGYYETDADKILSTGVSLDTESDEYKTVMAQLNNPVIYSLCGNFVNE